VCPNKSDKNLAREVGQLRVINLDNEAVAIAQQAKHPPVIANMGSAGGIRLYLHSVGPIRRFHSLVEFPNSVRDIQLLNSIAPDLLLA